MVATRLNSWVTSAFVCSVIVFAALESQFLGQKSRRFAGFLYFPLNSEKLEMVPASRPSVKKVYIIHI